MSSQASNSATPGRATDQERTPWDDTEAGGERASGSGRRGLLDHLLHWRDRLLASPRFQRWAAAFPLTRPIALRRSRQVFDLCAGFVYTQTVLSCVRLDLFSELSDGPADPAALARRHEIPLDRFERLVGASISLRLLRRTPSGDVALGALGAPLVHNEALAAMVEHNVLFYHDLRDPVDLLRGGPDSSTLLGRYWAYSSAADARSLTPDQVGPYSELMAASQPLVSREILDAYPFDRHQAVLDAGGGEGAFLEAVGRQHRDLNLMLFDLPAVAERGRKRLRSSVDPARVRVAGGDFFRDPLPGGADLVTLVRILHDHDDQAVLDILRSAHAALPPGGTVLIAEPMAESRSVQTVGAAYFSLYLLAMGQGRPRSAAEYQALLREAGFRDTRAPRPRAPVLTRIVSARR